MTVMSSAFRPHSLLSSEIALAKMAGLHQVACRAVIGDDALLQQDRLIGIRQYADVLLDDHDRRPVPADLRDDLEDRLREQRRKAERRLVDEQKTRARHQRTTDREHL